MPGVFIALDTCYVHKQVFEFDPDTVTTVWINPATNMPYDVREDPETGELVSIQAPNPYPPEAVQRPICDNCIRAINQERAVPIPLAKDQPQGIGTWPE